MAVKIFPRRNVVDALVGGSGLNGPDAPFVVDSMPLDNIGNEDLSRLYRILCTGNATYNQAYFGNAFIEVTHAEATPIQGICLAGLRFNTANGTASQPQVRIRQDDEPYQLTREYSPTAIASQTNVTAALAGVQQDPDDFGGTWPTFTGTAGDTTTLRVDIPISTFTLNSDTSTLPVDGHPVRILVGSSNGNNSSITVKYYENGVEIATLKNALGTTSFGTSATIASGGDVITAFLPSSEITTASQAEIQVECVAPTGGHAMAACFKCYADLASTYDSGFVDVFPAGWDAQLYPRSAGDSFFHYSASMNGSGYRTRIDFYDPAWVDGDSLDVGRVLIGEAESHSGWLLNGSSFGGVDKSQIVEGLGGGVFVEDRSRRRIASLELGYVTEQFRRDWVAYWDQRKGLAAEVCLIPDDTSSTFFYDGIYGRQVSMSPFTVFTQNSSGTYWRKLLEIEELVSD